MSVIQGMLTVYMMMGMNIVISVITIFLRQQLIITQIT